MFEIIMTMKNTWKIFVVSAFVTCLLPLVANAQDWTSTSSLQGTGSGYTSQITPVGAGNVQPMATTTNNAPQHKPGIRGSKEQNEDPGITDDPNSPIGDAVLPMLILALAFGSLIYYRRRSALNR